ncbi:hypothetical protein Bca4012_018062 [Brassica carinata]|uniref:Uncharacterized protein n=1 Tax=Brassica carinata TaxID=52824 RepID=A0A8X7WM77_BRACI|nr:hypothetical protein Bca52824_003539 [Brassica carinata]
MLGIPRDYFQFAAQTSIESDRRRYQDRGYHKARKETPRYSARSHDRRSSDRRGDSKTYREDYPRKDQYRPTHSRDEDRSLRSPGYHGRPHQMEEASSSPMLHDTPVRGVPLLSGKPFDAQAALVNAIGEVRDAMNQYTLCADPSESAARRERMLGMVKARAPPPHEAPSPASVMQPTSTERISALLRIRSQSVEPEATSILAFQRLGPLSPNPEETINSIMQRLGPLAETTTIAGTSTEAPRIKRKPGRPPGKKTGSELPPNHGKTEHQNSQMLDQDHQRNPQESRRIALPQIISPSET